MFSASAVVHVIRFVFASRCVQSLVILKLTKSLQFTLPSPLLMLIGTWRWRNIRKNRINGWADTSATVLSIRINFFYECHVSLNWAWLWSLRYLSDDVANNSTFNKTISFSFPFLFQKRCCHVLPSLFPMWPWPLVVTLFWPVWLTTCGDTR